jgi:hypothetical protein
MHSQHGGFKAETSRSGHETLSSTAAIATTHIQRVYGARGSRQPIGCSDVSEATTLIQSGQPRATVHLVPR